jgi:hypothetical protein
VDHPVNAFVLGFLAAPRCRRGELWLNTARLPGAWRPSPGSLGGTDPPLGRRPHHGRRPRGTHRRRGRGAARRAGAPAGSLGRSRDGASRGRRGGRGGRGSGRRDQRSRPWSSALGGGTHSLTEPAAFRSRSLDRCPGSTTSSRHRGSLWNRWHGTCTWSPGLGPFGTRTSGSGGSPAPSSCAPQRSPVSPGRCCTARSRHCPSGPSGAARAWPAPTQPEEPRPR